MIKTALALSLALSTFAVLPAVGAEQFQCPLPSNPNDPAKLERIRGLLPDVNTMTNIEQLNAAVATLRREGMSKSLIIDHLVGAYCPMVAREEPLTEADKAALVRRFTGQVTRLVYSLESGLDIIVNVPLTPDIVARAILVNAPTLEGWGLADPIRVLLTRQQESKAFRALPGLQ